MVPTQPAVNNLDHTGNCRNTQSTNGRAYNAIQKTASHATPAVITSAFIRLHHSRLRSKYARPLMPTNTEPATPNRGAPWQGPT